jgi:hypothetical protein
VGTVPERRKKKMLKIGIIVGSTRPGRKAGSVAKWVHDILKSRQDAEFEVVDIEDYKLPLLDEPVPPIMHQYGHRVRQKKSRPDSGGGSSYDFDSTKSSCLRRSLVHHLI